MDLALSGRTALVTGASKGIGLAVAKGLAAEGVDLHLAARTAADLDAARAEIADRYNISITTHPADLSDPEVRAKLAEAVGDIDILINNAGAIPAGGVEDIDELAWRSAWDLKVFGYIDFCRRYYPAMRERGSGVIINIAGIAGRMSLPGYIAGSTGNAALIAFSVSLGEESIKNGVRVVCINPGPTLTERLETLRRGWAQREFGDPERWQEIPENARLGRSATTEEVADLVTFFASDRASYSSGTAIDMG
jgi:NAD(P)-dependent dehydrogenase (short-subunit alcohol dehydrogenase family)